MDLHPIKWVAPSPLWPQLTTPGIETPSASFGAPALLRFTTDDFMQDFFSILATDPRKLGEFRAVRETWRGKLAQPSIPTPKKAFAVQFQRLSSSLRRPAGTGQKVKAIADAEGLPNLKLYQPAHMRYYLVAACLTCQLPGLPDRKVDAGKQQRVSFVLRRLFPATSTGVEYAWVKAQTGYGWQPVPEGIVLETEERLPLFPATLQDDDRRSRRLFAGLIPVGKREVYLSAPKITSIASEQPPGTSPITGIKILLRKEVIEPWKALIHQMNAAGDANRTLNPLSTDPIPQDGQRDGTRTARERAQTISWLILLDFSKWLSTYIPELWRAILRKQRPDLKQTGLAFDALNGAVLPTGLAKAVQNEYGVAPNPTSLQTIYSADPPKNLLAALAKFGDSSTGKINADIEKALESADQPYSRIPTDSRAAWPAFPFPLADPDSSLGLPLPPVPNLGTLQPEEAQDLSVDESLPTDPTDKQLDQLAVLLSRAIGESESGSSAPAPDVPAAAIPPAEPSGNPFLQNLFRIRCIYERPSCGPLHDDVVSDPSESFELAGFFDPDAPARPIRIGLPIDTTPAGLRKFDKNTAFIMSDVLCGQVKRFRSMTFADLVLSVLPWPFHKDLSAGGMKPCTGASNAPLGTICSLSIPIITICALILLMIMVALLDLIFGWLPFLMICFPLPGFKAKK